MDRRKFLELSLLAGTGVLFLPNLMASTSKIRSSIIGNDETDPRKIAIEKFRNARYGLFIHYGLYSLLGRGEWVQNNEKIPLSEYATLKDQFRAKKFDADFITDLALDAGMKYINLTTRHHDSFCLWDTKYSDFKSTNSPAKRDLVAALSEQCNKKGLDLFLYYSHGRDWKHPHAPNNDSYKSSARPTYSISEPSYKYGTEHDLNIYLEFVENQITELLEMFSPIAGIWLDGIGVPLSGDRSAFKCQHLYDVIHSKQPQVLVSYKQGLLGTEDFLAPEKKFNRYRRLDRRISGKSIILAGWRLEKNLKV
ncbi:MAG: alpha-L-fucosidase [Bacteroidia bacterium]|nr:alpha-L-fucosidase [Bacteroidia bacterium]